jgi:hydroxyethylthiazole kinase-like uncharacterized protein yjeF
LLGSAYGARVVLLVGPGNNGGDALWAGAVLASRGARVDALLATEDAHEPGLAALLRAGGRARPAGADSDAALLADADLVLDGLLGIGAKGALRPPFARLATLAGDADGVVVAVDVPSGVDASTGEVDGTAVRADVTVTFGALKAGLLVAPGAAYAGTVELVDIGLTLPPSRMGALDADDVARLLPSPGPETDKYKRGVVGVLAGSDRYPGAAVLAVAGALSAGAGMVRYVGAAGPAALVRQRWPEALVTTAEPGDGDALERAGRVQSWVVGSGLGTDAAAARWVVAALATDVPVVLDADALTIVAESPDDVRDRLAQRSAETLLTPHAGEFARLAQVGRGDVEQHRLPHVVQLAHDLRATVLLKGSTTLVAAPDGEVRVNTAQTPYLGTAGSGDVLSGICGTMLGAGLPALDAGAVSAFVHGLAGMHAAGTPAAPVTALGVAEHVPHAIRTVRR